MKRILATMTLTAAAFCLASVPAYGGPPKTTEQAVREAEQTYVNALVKGDYEVLRNLFDNQYLFTNTEGATLDKASHLARFKGTNYRFASKADIDDVKIRLSGNTAFVTGRLTFAGADTSPANGQSRYTHVWVKKGGRWRLVANHSHRIGS
jgi:ketosteroid isomerase-like protein